MITPYQFQLDAIKLMLGTHGFLLGDDMGIGKTVTALGEVAIAEDNSPVLIVCPKTVVSVWEHHCEQMIPHTIFTLQGSPKDRDLEWSCFDACLDPKVLLANWSQLKDKRFLDRVWDYVIADEAHYIKNRKAQRTRSLKFIRAKHKRALTGTPMVNRPDEMWSILNWLYPKRFTSYWKWFNKYIAYDINYLGFRDNLRPKNSDDLIMELEGTFLRRKKETVLPELPDKYYTTVEVELTPKQRRAYNSMKEQALAWVGEHEDQPLPAPVALAKLTRLRQFSTAFCQINQNQEVEMSEPSSKLDALIDIVDSTDEPIVIFSQFAQAVTLISDRLRDKDVTFSTLTGRTTWRLRRSIIDNFQTGRYKALVATTGTGGVGITLTRASTCVFVDRKWSPAENIQAEDRLHRKGQENAVQVIVLQAKDTVDGIVEDTLRFKADWFRQVLG